ncbi:MAG: CBS domain-containing protein, partial [Fulvivirga sp.]|nr:CBS domain-containing protein [Fulvivirga sp.]
PTLKKMDMELDNLTPNERSKAMIEAMKWLKKKNYSIRINGIDEISTTDFSNMFESCNTSFQIHYQLNPDEFVKKFNYALAIAAPVLAACTNSPILFAKRLWHETRIALFQQAVDTRESTEHLAKADLRVPFGDEWLEEPLTQIFEKDLAKYKLFLKHKDPENTKKVWEQGKIPQLVNLQTFNSSIFHWTRPCYGVLDGKPHLRIENRLLPAGPTIIDQVANTAFWTGLMHGMPDTYADLPNRMAFEDAKINTLKAARYGLTSQFRWIEGKKIKAAKLIEKELLPIAEKGLAKAKVHHGDVEKYLQIIRDRVQSEQTGSQWMLDTWRELEMLETGEAKARSLTALIKKYQSDQKPVHQWPTKIDDLPKLDYSEVGHLMISDLYCVQEEDLIDQVIFSMSKKDHAHVPVTNKNGQLKGMLYADKILNKVVINGTSASRPTVVKEVMEKDPLTVSPGTSLTKAIKQMKQHHIKCLPVEHKDKLVGIITEYDIMQIAEKFLKNKN